jgi:hypothetical protein
LRIAVTKNLLPKKPAMPVVPMVTKQPINTAGIAVLVFRPLKTKKAFLSEKAFSD